jgi:hypothetical protein
METLLRCALEAHVGEVMHKNSHLFAYAIGNSKELSAFIVEGHLGIFHELLKLLGAPPRAEDDTLRGLHVCEVHQRQMRLLFVVRRQEAKARGFQHCHHSGWEWRQDISINLPCWFRFGFRETIVARQ